MINFPLSATRYLLLRALTTSLLISSLITTSQAVRPIIALIPDAWHSPVHYLELTQYLSQAGYSITTQRLPSCGSVLPDVQSTAADASFIRENILLPQIDNGKSVVLVMHSYGGCPGAVAAKGLSMNERSVARQQGGIIGMIYICGFVIGRATILRDLLPNRQFDPWIVQYVRTCPSRTLPSLLSQLSKLCKPSSHENLFRATTNLASATPPKYSTMTSSLLPPTSPAPTSSINHSLPLKLPLVIPLGRILFTTVGART